MTFRIKSGRSIDIQVGDTVQVCLDSDGADPVDLVVTDFQDGVPAGLLNGTRTCVDPIYIVGVFK